MYPNSIILRTSGVSLMSNRNWCVNHTSKIKKWFSLSKKSKKRPIWRMKKTSRCCLDSRKTNGKRIPKCSNPVQLHCKSSSQRLLMILRFKNLNPKLKLRLKRLNKRLHQIRKNWARNQRSPRQNLQKGTMIKFLSLQISRRKRIRQFQKD